MRVLSLDISTSAGFAVLDEARGSGAKPIIVAKGTVKLDKPILGYGDYPWCYLLAADDMATRLAGLVREYNPDLIVIEETNLGKSRYAQKALEQIHCLVLRGLYQDFPGRKVIYLSSSEWRHVLGLQMTKEDKRNNDRLRRAKTMAKETGISIHEAKAKAGIKGKVNKKHLAIRFVNEFYGLNLRVKDDDVADAICLAIAALNPTAKPCDGV